MGRAAGPRSFRELVVLIRCHRSGARRRGIRFHGEGLTMALTGGMDWASLNSIYMLVWCMLVVGLIDEIKN